jgi:hypothetical protein
MYLGTEPADVSLFIYRRALLHVLGLPGRSVFGPTNQKTRTLNDLTIDSDMSNLPYAVKQVDILYDSVY